MPGLKHFSIARAHSKPVAGGMYHSRIEGFLVPSATGEGGSNLVVFNDHLRPDSCFRIHDSPELDEWLQDDGWKPRFELNSRRYKVKREDLARLSGFAPRTVAAWAAGEKPSKSSVRKLVEIHRYLQSLAELVEPSAIGPWLRAPNPAFDGATPLQLFERGEADRLWRMSYELESRQPG